MALLTPINDEQKSILDMGKSAVTDPAEKAASGKKVEQWISNLAANWVSLHHDFIFGVSPKDLKQRFDIKLFKEDDNYIYLSLKPKMGKDQEKYQWIRMALFGPKTNKPYLAARIVILLPNGDTEEWIISKTETNLAGISEKHFSYIRVPGFKYQSNAVPPNPEPVTPTKSSELPKNDPAAPLIKPE